MRVREKTATLEGVMTTIVPPPASPPPLDSNISMKELIHAAEYPNLNSLRHAAFTHLYELLCTSMHAYCNIRECDF